MPDLLKYPTVLRGTRRLPSGTEQSIVVHAASSAELRRELLMLGFWVQHSDDDLSLVALLQNAGYQIESGVELDEAGEVSPGHISVARAADDPDFRGRGFLICNEKPGNRVINPEGIRPFFPHGIPERYKRMRAELSVADPDEVRGWSGWTQEFPCRLVAERRFPNGSVQRVKAEGANPHELLTNLEEQGFRIGPARQDTAEERLQALGYQVHYEKIDDARQQLFNRAISLLDTPYAYQLWAEEGMDSELLHRVWRYALTEASYPQNARLYGNKDDEWLRRELGTSYGLHFIKAPYIENAHARDMLATYVRLMEEEVEGESPSPDGCELLDYQIYDKGHVDDYSLEVLGLIRDLYEEHDEEELTKGIEQEIDKAHWRPLSWPLTLKAVRNAPFGAREYEVRAETPKELLTGLNSHGIPLEAGASLDDMGRKLSEMGISFTFEED